MCPSKIGRAIFQLPGQSEAREKWLEFTRSIALPPNIADFRLCFRHFNHLCFMPIESEMDDVNIWPYAFPTLRTDSPTAVSSSSGKQPQIVSECSFEKTIVNAKNQVKIPYHLD